MYWLTGLFGLALIISPFAAGFRGDMPALYSTLILGAAIIVISAIQAFADAKGKWEYWADALLGVLVVVAPFILRFTNQMQALASSIVLGLGVVVFAVYGAANPHKPPTKTA
jgi:uncharacterized membrane protein HdeD (DUF308 family)